MNALRTAACSIVLALQPFGALAADDEPADAAAPDELAAWSCSSCPYPIGWSGGFEVGVAPTMGATAWSGRYTGVRDDGIYALLDADLLRLDADGGRWEIVAHDLGLDDRSLSVVRSLPGDHRYAFEYRALPALAAESALTPFDGAGSMLLTLPAGWVRADTTAAMSGLPGALRPVAIATEREQVSASADWFARRGFTTRVSARRESRTGTDAIGGSLITRATILPEPVDQVTDRFEAGIGYARPRWSLDARYSLSVFANDADSLIWDVPFTALNPAADQGRIALAPDNDFQQLALSGDWRGEAGLRVSGGLSLGRGRQDDALLPTSITPGLDLALPRASAALSVDTTSAWLRASRPIGDAFALRGSLRHDARDVDGAADAFPIVVTDTYQAPDRTPTAHAWDRTQLRAEGDWRMGSMRLQGSVQRKVTDREQGAVARNTEDSLALELVAPLFGVFDGRLGVGRDSRAATPFVAQAGPAPQNPLLRYYDTAEMDRGWWSATLAASPSATTNLEIRFEERREDYAATEVGLTDRDDAGFGFDLDWRPAAGVVMALYFQHQVLGYGQAGSASFAGPDWSAAAEDATEAVGLAFEATELAPGFHLSGELSLTDATGAVQVTTSGSDEFPEVRSRLLLLRIDGEWRLDDRFALRLGWRHERLDSSDWAVTGVAPDTVPALLALGEVDPRYETDVFELALTITP